MELTKSQERRVSYVHPEFLLILICAVAAVNDVEYFVRGGVAVASEERGEIVAAGLHRPSVPAGRRAVRQRCTAGKRPVNVSASCGNQT